MLRNAKSVLLSALTALFVSNAAAQAPTAKTERLDEFAWLTEFNKASAVMVVEQGIVSRQLGTQIAQAIAKVTEDAQKPGARRPGIAGYLAVEAQLIAAGGPDVSRLHSGRSRQDLLATYNRVVLRDRLLDLVAAQGEVRRRLQRISREHLETVIPAYTNGVQAQPTTLAHYLLAFDAALARDGARLRQAYVRVNRNPLGAAALGTSSFPVDRNRLARLLGFDAPEVNSYDANLVSSMDVPLEVVNIAEGTALTVGALVEDVVTQYRGTEPWLLLREGDLTGPSSIMPQKRNPYGLNDVRQAASKVVADAVAFAVMAHNISPGMLDYKTGQTEAALDDAGDMLLKLSRVLDALVVNVPRALAEVNADYSTTTELADVLQREYDVPFRIGHHFASELVSYGRARQLKPSELPYEEARRIYKESSRALGVRETELPLTEERFRKVLTAENMIQSSRVLGGPQRPEVTRMLTEQSAGLDGDQRWLQDMRQRLSSSRAELDKAFQALR